MNAHQSSSGEVQRLAQEVEELEYLNDVMAARLANIETANDERIPGWVVDRCLTGEAPALVWREYRGLTRPETAAVAGLTEALLTEIETGLADPGLLPMSRLALALRVDVDDLLPWAQDSDAAP